MIFCLISEAINFLQLKEQWCSIHIIVSTHKLNENVTNHNRANIIHSFKRQYYKYKNGRIKSSLNIFSKNVSFSEKSKNLSERLDWYTIKRIKSTCIAQEHRCTTSKYCFNQKAFSLAEKENLSQTPRSRHTDQSLQIVAV
ncbi:unnamed protein product [Albugo candida]|uniref:Uncharacterized protein n=1 Tax=Albugo candida TaxID=65357 RepID=A0A024GB35_9STRA|nr:unnamed protein product [Albugo candida]|eukprot:CCI44076.1 unnamed protein product [Albugo candida]